MWVHLPPSGELAEPEKYKKKANRPERAVGLVLWDSIG